MTWNPNQYLRFGDLRLRPAVDLMQRIPLESPRRIVDLGCGAGNVTRLLRQRWPQAELVGIDSSAEMLAKARELEPGIDWRQASIEAWSVRAREGERYDLIFSNAALHWLGGHRVLLPGLMQRLAPGGVLAVQMPDNFAAPSHTLLRELAQEADWREELAGAETGAVLTAGDYHALLSPLCSALDIWRTEYQQTLEGDDAVLNWVRGTALLPYLECLDASAGEAFVAAYRARLAAAYPRRADGTTLFPFARLFLVATNSVGG